MAKVRGLSAYFGITHGVPMWALGLWRRWLCVRNVHAFDEVASAGESPGVNRLVCDACQLVVNIEDIDTSFVDPRCLAALKCDQAAGDLFMREYHAAQVERLNGVRAALAKLDGKE